ncbi:MAG: hypothetical protein ABIH76_02220 [Candidatus Bathyarchaeota archaeon]
MTNKKVLPSLITISVLAILILVGSVEALILGFTVLDGIVTKGEAVEFQLSINIEQGEVLDITTITLVLNGPQDLTCRFLPDGTPIDPCPGIQITQTENTSYQYGYGYDQGFIEGFLKYNVILNSSTVESGQYQSYFRITTPETEFESPEQIVIIRDPDFEGSCSLRAIEGVATFEGQDFTSNNRLSLYAPAGGARSGRGTFMTQEGRIRVSYAFTIHNAYLGPQDEIIFDTSGTLKEDARYFDETATITFNRASSTIFLDGTFLEFQDMEISFERC